MAIHVTIGYNWNAPKGGPFITIVDEVFDEAGHAIGWWDEQSYNCPGVEEVLLAAKDEYVGTEHEVMTADGKNYTHLFVCIEGQEGKETFQERLPDFFLDKVIYMDDGRYQLEGMCNNKKTWMTVHWGQDTAFIPHNLPTND